MGGGVLDERDLQVRTKQFALRVIKLVEALPKRPAGWTIASQLCRAGTSVGANYRAACKGRSKAEFIAKLGTVEEEADECQFWLEMTIESGLLPASRVEPLLDEAKQITAIIAASKKTARSRQ
jgi:four helix bundle protein